MISETKIDNSFQRCRKVQMRKGTLLTIFQTPPDISTSPPAYYILHKFPTPCLLEPPSPPDPSLFGALEYGSHKVKT